MTLSARIADYLELTKLRLVSLTLWSTAAGFLLAHPGKMDGWKLALTLLGSGLVAAGSMSLNEWMERDQDKMMSRTQNRPVPSGRMDPDEALGLGIILSLLGLGLLLMKVNTLTAFLAWLTLMTYTVLYTPLKKITSFCTIVGAIPGALPPMMGWAAAKNEVTLGAWVLFAIIFFWQMPHFFAISWFFREDYKAAGFKMLSVEDPSGRKVANQIFLYTLALLPVSFLPVYFGMAGKIYLWGSAVMGAVLLAFSFKALIRLDKSARPFFRVSLLYLTLLFILMVVDKR